MNLGAIEALLLRALQPALPDDVECLAGPLWLGPAAGVRGQVFVHAARYDDAGGTTREGARSARRPWAAPGGAAGFAEERPACIEIDLQTLAVLAWQAQWLAGRIVAPALRALHGLALLPLGDPDDALARLDFVPQHAWVHAQRNQRLEHDGVALHQVLTTLRIDGLLHCRLAARDGLVRGSVHAGAAPSLEIIADPPGTDRDAEHLRLRNPTAVAIDLGGWSVEDTAKRVHRYRFPPATRIAARGELRLYSGRGSDRPGVLHWGRRQAVWNNSGDAAVLRDPDGVERARAVYTPPAKPVRRQKV
jgi:Lamin Tail Domain